MNIPIVLAADENYMAPTFITMYSALSNRKSQNNYDFYVLCPDHVCKEAVEVIRSLELIFSNLSIFFIYMGNRFSDLKMKIGHVTSPTFYRLCLPELLQENKCIYLDSDIIVKKDLSDLFAINLDGMYLAGVLSEGIHTDKVYAENLCKLIGLNDVNTYINAGVLLMDLQKLRNDGVINLWMKLIKKEFPAQDQDILNLTCYGKIKTIPLKYNAMTKCRALNCRSENINAKTYSKEEIWEARTDPTIIHYADKIKPWNNKNVLFAEQWWEIVYKTSGKERAYIEQFIHQNNSYKIDVRKYIHARIVRTLQILGLYVPLKRLIKQKYEK